MRWQALESEPVMSCCQGLSLSPGVYYDLMRTAVLMANAGYIDALGFAEHCLQEMSALGEYRPCFTLPVSI